MFHYQSCMWRMYLRWTGGYAPTPKNEYRKVKIQAAVLYYILLGALPLGFFAVQAPGSIASEPFWSLRSRRNLHQHRPFGHLAMLFYTCRARSTRCVVRIRNASCVIIRASCVWKNVSNLSRCVICSFVTSGSPIGQ